MLLIKYNIIAHEKNDIEADIVRQLQEHPEFLLIDKRLTVEIIPDETSVTEEIVIEKEERENA